MLSDFLPDVSFKKIDRARKQLLFQTPDGVLPLRSLSDGYQNVAAWIGDLLYRITNTFDDYTSPLEARGLLLIDEVDLHLHPRWQRRLLSFLSSRLPNFQVVATTHSPMTAQQAGDGELFYLLRDASTGVRLEAFEGSPRSLLISQLLMTDAFGLDSDESLEVERHKDRYRELRDRTRRTRAEEKELQELEQYLRERPQGGRSNLRIGEEHAELLRNLEKELRARGS